MSCEAGGGCTERSSGDMTTGVGTGTGAGAGAGAGSGSVGAGGA